MWIIEIAAFIFAKPKTSHVALITLHIAGCILIYTQHAYILWYTHKKSLRESTRVDIDLRTNAVGCFIIGQSDTSHKPKHGVIGSNAKAAVSTIRCGQTSIGDVTAWKVTSPKKIVFPHALRITREVKLRHGWSGRAECTPRTVIAHNNWQFSVRVPEHSWYQTHVVKLTDIYC